jgi:hypothetical protein
MARHLTVRELSADEARSYCRELPV